MKGFLQCRKVKKNVSLTCEQEFIHFFEAWSKGNIREQLFLWCENKIIKILSARPTSF